MKLQTTDNAFNCVNNALILSGAPRTGTTILGNLLATLKNQEYRFEPPTLRGLLALVHHGQISESIFRFLLESYAFDEILLPGLAGRNLNFNSHDDSYIRNLLSQEEIEERLSKSWCKYELIEKSIQHSLIIKLPAILHHLSLLRNIYPNIKILITIRNPMDTVRSICNKGWFSDRAVNGAMVLFPYYRFDNKYLVPEAIPLKRAQEWVENSEVNRSLIYYKELYKNIVDFNDLVLLDYADLVKSPFNVLNILSDKFDFQSGSQTEYLLSIIEQRAIKNWDNWALASKNYRNEAEVLYHRLKESSI